MREGQEGENIPFKERIKRALLTEDTETLFRILQEFSIKLTGVLSAVLDETNPAHVNFKGKIQEFVAKGKGTDTEIKINLGTNLADIIIVKIERGEVFLRPDPNSSSELKQKFFS